MANCGVIVVDCVRRVLGIADGIHEVGKQASRLIQRVSTIEARMSTIVQGTMPPSSESLIRLLEAVQDIHEFLTRYKRTGDVNRAFNRNEYATKFAEFTVALMHGVQTLQLDIDVNGWAKEDAKDRADDLEYMMELLEEMEANRRGDYQQVVHVLKVNKGQCQQEESVLSRA